MLRFSGTGRSHVGLVRDGNEDSGFVGASLLLVADGVGGNAGGEVASATTAYVVSAEVLARPGDDPADVLATAVGDANRELAHGVLLDPELTGMATTLTALLCDGERFALAHLGDSRGYVFRDGELTRVTTDHTWVQEMVDEGRLQPEEVATHPWRNVVMRSVNGEDETEADIVPLALRVGDRVLLCSDGVTDLVSEQRLEQLVGRFDDDEAAELIEVAALEAGGRDNITVVLASVIDGPTVLGDGQLLGALFDPHNVVDPALVRFDASA